MKRRAEEWVLVPAGFRERRGWLNERPRTWEEIQEAERAAAESKRLADQQKDVETAKAAEEEASFQLKKAQAEAQSALVREESMNCDTATGWFYMVLGEKRSALP
jgi:hypothetical protein